MASDTEPPDAVAGLIAELKRLDKTMTEANWTVFDGCSWRRIGHAQTHREILWPCKDRNDGHPDMGGVNRDVDLAGICRARNALSEIIDALESCRTEIAALRAERAWRPIESVPHDRVVLLFMPTGIGLKMVTGYWPDDHMKYTHWQPLPTPPEQP